MSFGWLRIFAFAALGNLSTVPVAVGQTAIDSDSVSESLTLNCIGTIPFVNPGTVRLNYSASLSASVSGYIEQSTNDARVSATVTVDNSRTTNCGTGAFLSATPVAVFGENGSAAITYGGADPLESTVRIDRPGDRFESGTYRVSGDDGAAGFSLSFSLSVGAGVSLSQADEGPIILLPSSDQRKIVVGNKVYTDNVGTRWRGGFRDGGRFTLSDFFIRTGTESQAEFGDVIIRIPVYKARIGAGIMTITSDSVGTLDARLRYIRGDFLREPIINIVPERRFVGLGETVQVTVEVYNDSNVNLIDGQAVLDLASAGGRLVADNTVREFDNTPYRITRELVYSFTAEAIGQVRLRWDVEGGWAAPVPTTRRYSRTIEMAGVIEVTEDSPPIFRDGFELQDAPMMQFGFE